MYTICGKYEKSTRTYLPEYQENRSFQEGERGVRQGKGTEKGSAC